MRWELRPFVREAGLVSRGPAYEGVVGRHTVIATTMGVGPSRASHSVERLLARGDVERVVVVGVAGGIDPALAVGSVMVPEEVVDGLSGASYPNSPGDGVVVSGRLVTFDEVQVAPDVLARLRRQGFAAVDMETAAVAAACARRGCPLSVFRAISDDATAGSVDPAVAAMARPDGSSDVGAAVRYLVRRPWRAAALVSLGRDAQRAAKVATKAALAALATDA
jgi:nucleoside phosphorylase